MTTEKKAKPDEHDTKPLTNTEIKMFEFGWHSCIEQVLIQLRSKDYHDAADAIKNLRPQ